MSEIIQPSALAPFRVRSFRFQWPADLATSLAFEMESLILGWYVLVTTGSVVLLTVFAALLNVGTLVAPMFGVIGDRIGQRNVLFSMRLMFAGLASCVASLAFTGVLSPAYVFVVVSLLGLVRPSDMGTRGALIGATVPVGLLTGAMGISRTTQDSARIMGSLTGAGLFVVFGIGRAYLVVISFYLLGALLARQTGPEFKHERSAALAGGKAPTPWRDLKEGLAYTWNTPRLLAAMCIALLSNAVAFPLMTGLLTYVARSVYHTNQTGLGTLLACTASGALTGSIGLSVVGDRLRSDRVMVVTMVIWFAVILVFAHLRSMGFGLICLFCMGFLQSMCMVSLSVILLRTAEPQYRGRVMGARMLVVYGHPLGLLAAGPLIERIGFATTASLYGVFGLIFAALIILRWHGDIWRLPGASEV